jgi:hypothetical protein
MKPEDPEQMDLLQKVLDKRPDFTNNYVNFNKPVHESTEAKTTPPEATKVIDASKTI